MRYKYSFIMLIVVLLVLIVGSKALPTTEEDEKKPIDFLSLCFVLSLLSSIFVNGLVLGIEISKEKEKVDRNRSVRSDCI